MTARSESAHTLLHPAQTNLELYSHLHALGYAPPQLCRVRDAYRLALSLFSDRYRASGKPFLAHLVGTASILAAAGARAEIVTAGLVHAVYDNGVFADGIGGATPAHRRVVKDCAGAEVEALVAAYHALRWKRAIAEPILQNRAFSSELRDVLLMRIANEIEDHVGLGMRLCAESRSLEAVPRETHVALAEALDRPDLAEALRAAYRETDAADWAAPLATEHAASYRVPSNAGMTGRQHLAAAARAAAVKLRRWAGWAG